MDESRNANAACAPSRKGCPADAGKVSQSKEDHRRSRNRGAVFWRRIQSNNGIPRPDVADWARTWRGPSAAPAIMVPPSNGRQSSNLHSSGWVIWGQPHATLNSRNRE